MSNPRRRLPSLQALRAFDAAARRLHFTHAAEELSVTPGAVSRQIQALEEDLGVLLFERRHRTVTLTAEGKAYALEVAGALDRLEVATSRARVRLRMRPLSICAYPTFAMRWLIPRWRRFQEMHPSIDLQLTTSLEAVDVLRDGFDAVVRFSEQIPADVSGLQLVDTEIFPVCSPALAANLRTAEDLRRCVLIDSESRPYDWQRWLNAADVAIGGKEGQRLKFESLSLVYQAAIEGVGVAMGIGCLVEDDLQAQRLVRPFPLVQHAPGAFYLLYSPSSRGDSRLLALLDFFQQEGSSAVIKCQAGK